MNVSPVKLRTSYNTDTKIFTIKPDISHGDIKFNEIGYIKFGNSKTDENFCDVKTFQYTVASSDKKDDNLWTYQLTSVTANPLIKPLVATFTQMDDLGTINVEITTKEDYDAPVDKKILYRPPADAVFNPKLADYFPRKDLKKKLSDFVEVEDKTFSYTIY